MLISLEPPSEWVSSGALGLFSFGSVEISAANLNRLSFRFTAHFVRLSFKYSLAVIK